MKLPIVALIGQTNAGKSSLLNRFARKNLAIVAREQGTTRDNVISRIDNAFILIDTAGLKNPEDDFEANIQNQITDAIASADLILLVLDATKYLDQKDLNIARSALRSKKPVFLVLNKSDQGGALDEDEFRSLGISDKNTFRASATTGQGISALKSAILKSLKTTSDINIQANSTSEQDHKNPSTKNREIPLKIALIGRPNVGKSSFFNTLGKKQQALVSSRQGTTRDINRLELKFKNRSLEILDTAGLRKPGKREVGIEKFSAIRSLAAIEESDLCALLIDATESHSKLDQSLAGQIVKAGKGIVLLVTKTDLIDDTDFVFRKIESDFNFLPYAPILLTSSVTGKNATKLFDLALTIDEARHHQIKTSDLNAILQSAISQHPPAGLKNAHPKPKYLVQTDTCPPWFVIHGHELQLIHWSYERFLERKIRETYPYVGTPIFLSFRSDG